MNFKTCISAFILLSLIGCSADTIVSVNNQSGQALRNVTISSSGFRKGAALISAGKTVSWRIPKGRTDHFAIAFDLREKSFSYSPDVYFESEDWEVVVTVDATGRASVDENLASMLTQIVGRW
ncbi:hypothetical protein [Massilia aerilata]|uniref:Uncharacterized protein n=1 Tax=Massilia aerilata TaxID=453817 RepID=A0ABW0S4K7_9BURK